ncbi:glycerophosphodiester phosphodiesterase [Aciditerrimonas ferrireducens]|uniref:Glycerophosphodiester phosphodiesterase n=1 Tax=Aciditerrimonas ferrireducens TaxID=667306 RepID=A0ABV6C085_9ACTN
MNILPSWSDCKGREQGRSGGRPVVLAHRGLLRGRAGQPAAQDPPENSLAAFEQVANAAANGVAGVEVDARLSADGVVVVHHDPQLADGRLLAEVPAADLPPGVPTLRAALAALRGRLVDVEVKASPLELGPESTAALVRAVVACLAETRREVLVRPGPGPVPVPGPVPDPAASWLLSCFWPEALEALGAAAAEADLPLARGWLLRPGLQATALLGRAEALGATWVLPFVEDLDPVAVAAAQEAGFGVMTWTVLPGPALGACLTAGVDGVIADEALAVAAEVRAATEPPSSGLVEPGGLREQSRP